MHRIPALPLLALTLIGAPLMAQGSVRDFTLPQPTPTATPQVQGPADDSGVVPIGPRVIPTERPTPQPSPRPTPTAAASPAPRVTATPTVQARPTPSARPTAQAYPQATTRQPAEQAEASQQPVVPSPLDSGLSLPPAPATASPQTASPATNATGAREGTFPVWLQWVLGGMVFLAGLLAILAVILRRKRRPTAPRIERPIVHERAGTAAPPATLQEPRFDTRIEIESLARSFRMVTVKYRIEIANRGERALRDLAFALDLVSTARGAQAREQLAHDGLALPAAGMIERVGPRQSQSISGTVQMPIEAVEVFAQGRTPVFIPLIRLRIDGPDIGARAHTYALGLPGISESRVNPLPLDNPLGSYQGVRAVRVDQV